MKFWSNNLYWLNKFRLRKKLSVRIYTLHNPSGHNSRFQQKKKKKFSILYDGKEKFFYIVDMKFTFIRLAIARNKFVQLTPLNGSRSPSFIIKPIEKKQHLNKFPKTENYRHNFQALWAVTGSRFDISGKCWFSRQASEHEKGSDINTVPKYKGCATYV